MLVLKIGKGFEMEVDVGVAAWKAVGSVFLRLGKGFEMEVDVGVAGWKVVGSMFLRLGKLERFWNTNRLPDGSWPEGTY